MPVERWDFSTRVIAGWTIVKGTWTIENVESHAARPVLVQRAEANDFNVIVAPLGPYSGVDVSMKFRPISGREDASGGIVFRFDSGRDYLIRANALENNFRLYYYAQGRRMLATTNVKPPALARWHAVRVVAPGDRIQGWLDGRLLLDHRDARFRAGRVGLSTKADSITAFDALTIRGVPANA